MNNDDCPFCGRIKRGEYDDDLSLPGSVAVFEPLTPVTRGHLLVVPWEHVRDAASKPHVTGSVMEHAARLLANFSSPAEGPYQANIITSIGPLATQSVPHFHAHIVPRREDDGLALPWTAQKERDQIDPEKLDLLADWMDTDDAAHGRTSAPEVQADLRRWAKLLRGGVPA